MKNFILLATLFSMNSFADDVAYLGIRQYGSAVDVGASDASLMKEALKSAVKNAVDECVEDYQGVPAVTACVTKLTSGAILKTRKSAGVHKAVAKVKLYCRASRKNVSDLNSFLFERDGTNFSDCEQRVSVKEVLGKN
jgi:hypothetical protein